MSGYAFWHYVWPTGCWTFSAMCIVGAWRNWRAEVRQRKTFEREFAQYTGMTDLTQAMRNASQSDGKRKERR